MTAEVKPHLHQEKLTREREDLLLRAILIQGRMYGQMEQTINAVIPFNDSTARAAGIDVPGWFLDFIPPVLRYLTLPRTKSLTLAGRIEVGWRRREKEIDPKFILLGRKIFGALAEGARSASSSS